MDSDNAYDFLEQLEEIDTIVASLEQEEVELDLEDGDDSND